VPHSDADTSASGDSDSDDDREVDVAARGRGPYFAFAARGRAAAFDLSVLQAFDPVAAAALPYRAAHLFRLLPADVVTAVDAAVGKQARRALRRLTRRRPMLLQSAAITRFHRQAVLGDRVVDSNCAFFTVGAAMQSRSEANPGSETRQQVERIRIAVLLPRHLSDRCRRVLSCAVCGRVGAAA
jgi:hypothetical protein